MKRRIIRSFFIALLLLCVGGWVWSYSYMSFIGHAERKSEWVYDCGIFGGRLYFGVFHGLTYYEGWEFYQRRYYREFEANSRSNDFHLLGFRLSYESVNTDWIAEIPFYFPTTLSAVLLWLIWRKSWRKAKGRAFPVELEKPIEKIK